MDENTALMETLGSDHALPPSLFSSRNAPKLLVLPDMTLALGIVAITSPSAMSPRARMP